MSDPDPLPDIEDDAAWAAIAAEHGHDCEWVLTRAHRIEVPRGPRRPEIGRMVNVRMPDDMITALDVEARLARASQVEMIRMILWEGIYTARMGLDYEAPLDAGVGTDADGSI